MQITKETINHLAELSKLEFTEEETFALQKDLQINGKNTNIQNIKTL